MVVDSISNNNFCFIIECFLNTITLFLMNITKKTALFAQLYKINYICTVFYAVTYKVTDEEKPLRKRNIICVYV